MTGKGHEVRADSQYATKMKFATTADIVLRERAHYKIQGNSAYCLLPEVLQDWVGCVAFHPMGSLLITTSGDTTAKLWSITEERCIHTFSDHTLPVWACSVHDGGT